MSRRSLLYRKKLLQVGQVPLRNPNGGVCGRDQRMPKDVTAALLRVTDGMSQEKFGRLVMRFST